MTPDFKVLSAGSTSLERGELAIERRDDDDECRSLAEELRPGGRIELRGSVGGDSAWKTAPRRSSPATARASSSAAALRQRARHDRRERHGHMDEFSAASGR
jgi:hypothetical protein